MPRKKMNRPEEMGEIEPLEDRYAISLTKEGTKEAIEIRDRLMKDYIQDVLACKDETGKSVMNVLTENWIQTMLKNGVTSKDMQTIMKLKGEDVQRTQSVSLRLKAETQAKQETVDFLKKSMEE